MAGSTASSCCCRNRTTPSATSCSPPCGCLGIAILAAGRLLRAGNLPFAAAAPYAAAAALTPLAGLAIAYLRIAQGAASLPLAASALLLAAAFAGRHLAVPRRAAQRGPATRTGSASVRSPPRTIAAAAFALVFALDGGMLTVAFALAAVGTAFVAVRLDLAALRWCVAALGILVGARLAWDPRIVGGALSTTPIFNWLLFGYGIPALSFVVAGRVMRTRGDDTPVRVADALGLLFAAFLVFFEIRHAMNGGDPFAPGSGLVEQGLLAVASFGFGIVLTRLDASRSNVVFRIASLAAGAIGMGLAVIGLGAALESAADGRARRRRDDPQRAPALLPAARIARRPARDLRAADAARLVLGRGRRDIARVLHRLPHHADARASSTARRSPSSLARALPSSASTRPSASSSQPASQRPAARHRPSGVAR